MKWFNKVKNEVWFQITIALAIVVAFYFVLQHLGTIWTGVKVIWNIIVPLIVGLIIAYIIDPLVRVFERTLFKKVKRRNIARYISIAISIVLVVAAVVAILWILIPQLITSVQVLVANLGDYMANLEKWLKSIGGGIFASQVSDINFTDISARLAGWLGRIASGENIINASVSVGSSLISFLMSAILSVYYLVAKDRLIDMAKKFFAMILKEKRYDHFINFCSSCNKILVRYIWCTLLEALMVGVANAILMLIFRMPYVAIISVVVGVFNLAPTFGPIAGGVIGAFILIMVDPWKALIFIIITIVLQAIDGYIVKPRLFSGTLGVSALLILVSIIVLGRIFGVVGILFAIPFAAIVQYVFKRQQRTRQARKEEALKAETEEEPEEESEEE